MLSRVIDLTHTMCEDMPVFPGTEPPRFSKECTIEKNGFVEHCMTMYTHTGTHIDAPGHILAYGKTLDLMPVDAFTGPASVIDLRYLKLDMIDNKIKVAALSPHYQLFQNSSFILFLTGWDQFWGSEAYFHHFPVLSEEAALWIRQFQLKGVGFDTISVDPTNALRLTNHKILLESFLIIENLTHLDYLPTTGFTFCCFPLKLAGADGSPVRAVALLPKDESWKTAVFSTPQS